MAPSTVIEPLEAIIDKLYEVPPCQLERNNLEVKGWCKTEKEFWKKAADCSVCFANADGGILLLGPEDNQTIQHTPVCPHKPPLSTDWVWGQIQKYTHPPVKCEVYTLGDSIPSLPRNVAACIVVNVPKKGILGKHATHAGICLVRNHNECEVDHLTSIDDYTSIIVEDASLDDLNRDSLNWAFRNSKVTPRMHSRWRSTIRPIEDLLVDFNLVVMGETGPPTISLASLLLFGSSAWLKRYNNGPFLRVTLTGPESAPYSYHFEQNLTETLKAIWLQQGVLWACFVNSVPVMCLRELIVNALIHRDYRLEGSINIRIASEDKIEIQNAGGLLRSLTSDNLIHGNPVHRNRLLTEAVSLLGFCEKSGSGIDTVYREAVCNGYDLPHFTSDRESFSAIVPLTNTSDFSRFIQRRGRDFQKLESLIMIRFLYASGGSALSELARIVQRPASYTSEIVKELRKRDVLIDSMQSTYDLAPSVRADIENPVDLNQRKLFE